MGIPPTTGYMDEFDIMDVTSVTSNSPTMISYDDLSSERPRGIGPAALEAETSTALIWMRHKTLVGALDFHTKIYVWMDGALDCRAGTLFGADLVGADVDGGWYAMAYKNNGDYELDLWIGYMVSGTRTNVATKADINVFDYIGSGPALMELKCTFEDNADTTSTLTVEILDAFTKTSIDSLVKSDCDNSRYITTDIGPLLRYQPMLNRWEYYNYA